MVDNRETVAHLVARLQQLPQHYKIDFSPGECQDVTSKVRIEICEGDTSDGPGSAWMVLEESPLPHRVDFTRAFISALHYVVENGYSRIGNPGYYDDKAEFDCDLDSAIHEALQVLSVPVPTGDRLDWLAPLYEIADSLGYRWVEDEAEEDDAACAST